MDILGRIFGGGGLRAREHAFERAEELQGGLAEPALRGPEGGGADAGGVDAGGASARPPSNSLKVFSSTSNPLLPSQLEPVGNVSSTSRDLPRTSSMPPRSPVIGTGTARGVCARSPTLCQSISLS